MKRAIEESFPIVEINRLAQPERNAFKPIYQMHKWFARRASCVFRAILLGALKPAGTDIMEEFYKDHTHDPDTNGKKILDPFMGGGTTVVEALRLGCHVTGVDLNPVAWFIVKTETEPVDPAALDAAFDSLARRIVPWSGRSVEETLADLYRTDGAWTADGPAPGATDLIYTFWVKAAPCTSPTCRKLVPLFKDFVVAAKKPSVRYHPGCLCPKCGKSFDWETEPAALVDDPRLMIHSGQYSGGEGRTTTRWTYAHPEGGVFVAQGNDGGGQSRVRQGEVPAGHVCCPHCYATVRPTLPAYKSTTKKETQKAERKKVPVHVLLCPVSEEVFQWRGELPEGEITSPAGHRFDPRKANMPDKGEFTCPHCGQRDDVIKAIRSLPDDELLPMHAYAVQAWSSACDPGEEEEEEEDDLFSGLVQETPPTERIPKTRTLVWKQSGKFFARHRPADQTRIQQAARCWKQHKDSLPWPKSEIPEGFNTNQMIKHNYRYWHQMFNERQLLALSTLLWAVGEEAGEAEANLLLAAFSNTLEANNMFTRSIASRTTPGGTAPAGVFARHDYQPKMTVCEQNVLGTVSGNNTFKSRISAVRAGLEYARLPYDGIFDAQGKHGKRIGIDPLKHGNTRLLAGDSREIVGSSLGEFDVVITDPPYSDNVNYSELADFFFVWLRLFRKHMHGEFLPEYCAKHNEIVENKTRGLSASDFQEGLTEVFRKSHAVLKVEGTLVFTFHHARGESWENVLNAVCQAGFMIEAVYPVHSEREASLHLMDKEAISYDLIHVCRKRAADAAPTARSWAGLRQQVRKLAREEVERIEAGRYGKEPLVAPDVRMVLIGKCLEVYSRHYGQVLDWQGNPMPLVAALKDIQLMVDQVVSRENPLPAELDKIDARSQVWLLAFCDRSEVSFDAVSKLTRGVFEVDELTGCKPPLIRKGRLKEGRTYKVLSPQERLNELVARFDKAREAAGPDLPGLDLPVVGTGVPGADSLVDLLHVLLGLAAAGERLDVWVDRFDAAREPIRAGLEFLEQKDPKRWKVACDRLLPYYKDTLLAPPGGPDQPK